MCLNLLRTSSIPISPFKNNLESFESIPIVSLIVIFSPKIKLLFNGKYSFSFTLKFSNFETLITGNLFNIILFCSGSTTTNLLILKLKYIFEYIAYEDYVELALWFYNNSFEYRAASTDFLISLKDRPNRCPKPFLKIENGTKIWDNIILHAYYTKLNP